MTLNYLILIVGFNLSCYASYISYGDYHVSYNGRPKLLSQSVKLDKLPTKTVKITKTIVLQVPIPYPVQIPYHVPLPEPVNQLVPVPVPKIVKILQHIPYEVSKHVPVEVKQQVPLIITKTVQFPHLLPIDQTVQIPQSLSYPLTHTTS